MTTASPHGYLAHPVSQSYVVIPIVLFVLLTDTALHYQVHAKNYLSEIMVQYSKLDSWFVLITNIHTVDALCPAHVVWFVWLSSVFFYVVTKLHMY